MNSNCTSKITKVRAPFHNDLSFAGFAAFPYERLRIFGQLVFSHNPTMEDEDDVVAPFMIPSPRARQEHLCGIVNRRIATIQRAWRRWWKEQHHKDIIGLAFFFVDLYAKCRREGLVLPSLDYERKLAARQYGGAHKERRRIQRMINHYERVHGPW